MKSDSSHSHPDKDTPDPYKPGYSPDGLFGNIAMQAICALTTILPMMNKGDIAE